MNALVGLLLSGKRCREMYRELRFFRWFRTLPILAMLAVALLSYGFGIAPKSVLRQFLFPMDYREQILASAQARGVDPLLVCAVIKCESSWDPNAYSEAGAVGLMQLMPATSEELALAGLVDSATYDPANLSDPATNIEYGCAYLANLSSMLGSTDEVIAAYNAGPGSVASWLSNGEGDISSLIGYPETALYLMRVKESYKQYQQLYDSELNPL